jgi:hypothetical protein
MKAGNNPSIDDEVVDSNEIYVDNTLPEFNITTRENRAYIFAEDEHIKAVMQNGRIIGRKNGEYETELELGKNIFTVIDEYGNDVTIEKTHESVFEVHTSIANDPVLGEGMKAVYYEGNTKKTSSYFTDTMYDYTQGAGAVNNTYIEWANAETPDESLWE